MAQIHAMPAGPSPDPQPLSQRMLVSLDPALGIEESADSARAETRDLLHRRLRAASLILALGLTLFLARDLLFAPILAPPMVLHGLTILLLLLNLAALSSRWKPSLSELHRLEVVTFGMIIAFLIAAESLGLQARLQNQQLTSEALRLLFKKTVVGTLIILFTYAIFIPNHWTRACRVIVPMSLAPLVAPAILGLGSPSFRALSEEAITANTLSENLLFLALGAATAIFGTHTIHGVRRQATRARRLNQYRLTEKLGSGGMGEVYLAEHQLLKRPCAVKLIRPNLSEKPRVLARFELEVRATARLSHWNTVEVYDYGRTRDGTFYYVMEYLPGLSLQELVDRHGALPPGRVIYLLRQACDALREAHQAGLIHRDLKPPNIFAACRGARYDVAKLLDFGLVKPIHGPILPDLTGEGMVTGSPLYMAPEQVTRTHPPDPRTDIYAIGGIAYFLLTGRPAFLGPDSLSVMASQVRDRVVPPSEHRPGISPELEAIVLKCLEKSPGRRFQDAESLARALGACPEADDWSARHAEDWWRERESSAAPGSEEPEPAAANSEECGLTRGEDASPTLDASEIDLASRTGIETGLDHPHELELELDLDLGEDATRPDLGP